MKKLCLCILLVIGGCKAEPKLEEPAITYDYDHSTPDEIFDFYQTLALSEVVADVMNSDGIVEYRLNDSGHLNMVMTTLQEMDTGYFYQRPEDSLYIIYQLTDKNGETYIMESYIDVSDDDAVYYSVNEYNLAFKVEEDTLYNYVIENADEIIDTGYKLTSMEEWHGRRGLIDGPIEEGLVKYADADHWLSEAELLKNTQQYDEAYTDAEFLENDYFAVAEKNGIVRCLRFKSNSLGNTQLLPQMYRKKDRHQSLRGLEVLSFMLYHMDEVELVEVNKNDMTSKVIKEASSNYVKTSPIAVDQFIEVHDDRAYHLALDAEHAAAKLFNEVMFFKFNWTDVHRDYQLRENNQLISLVFPFAGSKPKHFIFVKETGLTLSDNDINAVAFNGDPNQTIRQYMAQKNIGVCIGVYEEMMNEGDCYVEMEWSIDSHIQPEYRVTTTHYTINDQGQLVLPILIKNQGVFDRYDEFVVDY